MTEKELLKERAELVKEIEQGEKAWRLALRKRIREAEKIGKKIECEMDFDEFVKSANNRIKMIDQIIERWRKV